MRFHLLVAAAVASTALVANVGPAGAVVSLNVLNFNGLTFNALAFKAMGPASSQLDELNGVAVEAVTLPPEPAR
jgi:hypothetical protein